MDEPSRDELIDAIRDFARLNCAKPPAGKHWKDDQYCGTCTTCRARAILARVGTARAARPQPLPAEGGDPRERSPGSLPSSLCTCGHPEHVHKWNAAECGEYGCPCNVYRQREQKTPGE